MNSTLRTDFSKVKSIFGFCVQLQNLKSFLQKVNLDLPINCNKTVIIVLVTCIEDPYAFNPTVAYYRRVEKLFWLLILGRHKRPLDSRTRMTASTRIDFKFFRVFSLILDFPENFILPLSTRKVRTVIFEGGYMLFRSQNENF